MVYIFNVMEVIFGKVEKPFLNFGQYSDTYGQYSDTYWLEIRMYVLKIHITRDPKPIE